MSRKSSINKIKRSNLVSKDIESGLVMELYQKGHSPISTHASVYGLQECDVISISKSDYIYEYEVKISRSDFKADFKKPKHTLITEKKFIKVVPENLVSVEEVPEYAGLMYANERGGYDIIKKAPIIHKTKASNEFIRALSHQLTCKLVFKKVS